MYIDFVALMLVDLVIGLVMVAVFLWLYPEPAVRTIAPGLLMAGFVLLSTGLAMIFTWPLPGSYNVSFGEPAVLFGTVLAALGVCLLADWSLLGPGIFAFFAGLVAVVVGIRLINLGQTRAPVLSGVGYILSGVGGLLALPVYALRGSRALRVFVAVILLVAAVIWAIVGYGAYWDHMQSFSEWKPLPMR